MTKHRTEQLLPRIRCCVEHSKCSKSFQSSMEEDGSATFILQELERFLPACFHRQRLCCKQIYFLVSADSFGRDRRLSTDQTAQFERESKTQENGRTLSSLARIETLSPSIFQSYQAANRIFVSFISGQCTRDSDQLQMRLQFLNSASLIPPHLLEKNSNDLMALSPGLGTQLSILILYPHLLNG